MNSLLKNNDLTPVQRLFVTSREWKKSRHNPLFVTFMFGTLTMAIAGLIESVVRPGFFPVYVRNACSFCIILNVAMEMLLPAIFFICWLCLLAMKLAAEDKDQPYVWEMLEGLIGQFESSGVVGKFISFASRVLMAAFIGAFAIAGHPAWAIIVLVAWGMAWFSLKFYEAGVCILLKMVTELPPMGWTPKKKQGASQTAS